MKKRPAHYKINLMKKLKPLLIPCLFKALLVTMIICLLIVDSYKKSVGIDDGTFWMTFQKILIGWGIIITPVMYILILLKEFYFPFKVVSEDHSRDWV